MQGLQKLPSRVPRAERKLAVILTNKKMISTYRHKVDERVSETSKKNTLNHDIQGSEEKRRKLTSRSSRSLQLRTR